MKQSLATRSGKLLGTPGNNKAHPSHSRDPTYYHVTGNTVFRVEGVLFKFAAFSIQPDSTPFVGVDNLPRDLTTSSDDAPIVLSGVKANEFRNFLFAIVGRPSDPEFQALFTRAQDKGKHTKGLAMQYLDIASLARRFGKTRDEEWAREQLCLVLESTYKLALDTWDDRTIIRLDAYARSTEQAELLSLVTRFIQYFISISPDDQNGSQLPSPSNLDTCVRLYKNPSLPFDNPALFGCVFTTILSLGRRSPVWSQTLAPKDRLLLYAAQVGLDVASEELGSVGWLQTLPDALLSTHKICDGCRTQFGNLWKKSFGQCAGLRSKVALQDVTALAHLPRYRKTLTSQWDASKACFRRERPKRSTMGSLDNVFAAFNALSLSSISPPEVALATVPDYECSKLKNIVGDIDSRIQEVYWELAQRHDDFVPGD